MTTATGVYTLLVPAKPERKPVKEAAEEVGISEGTVWRYLERGLLERFYIRVGRRKTVVDMKALRELIANPPSEPAER